MKKCNKCGESKSTSEFSVSKNHRDGLQPYCKDCNRLTNRNYRRSLSGFIRCKFNDMRVRGIGNYGFDLTLDELKKWMLSQPNFQELWDNWVASGYKKELCPSVDRINDYKPYEVGNIQLITWKENKDKSIRDIKNGVNTKGTRAVVQYSLKGFKIDEYVSIAIAERETGISQQSISMVCRNLRKTAGGFVWSYKK